MLMCTIHMFTHSFLGSFNNYSLSMYYVMGTSWLVPNLTPNGTNNPPPPPQLTQGSTLRINIQQRIVWETLWNTVSDDGRYTATASLKSREAKWVEAYFTFQGWQKEWENAFTSENDESPTKGHPPRPSISRPKEVWKKSGEPVRRKKLQKTILFNANMDDSRGKNI